MTTASSSPGGNTLRNIIVGVITTVLGSAAVYFLGFHKNERSSAEAMLFTKEATTKAWDDYVVTENMFAKNWNTLASNYTTARFKIYKEETLEELDKFFRDIQRIIETKDVDPTFVSLLKRRMAAKQQWEKKYRIHLDNFEYILNNTPQEQQTQKINEELNNFQFEIKDLDARYMNELENVAKSLSNNYRYNFSTADLVAFKKTETNQTSNTSTNTATNTGATGVGGQMASNNESLVGKWLIDQSWYIYHYDDGKLYMYFTKADGTRDSTYGTWQLYNNRLYHNATYYFNTGNQWVYDVSDITANSFTLKMTAEPFTTYFVRRVNY